eukprot:SM000253S09041  [mRNA]  locus=s253:145051:152434:- [translate_table: standard]
MAIHFKFRSAVDFDSLNIDGHFISVGNLKERIIEHKNLGNGLNFDLVITNAQTSEDYTDDAFLVPRNTSVIIKRVPATRSRPALQAQTKSSSSQQPSPEKITGPMTTSRPAAVDDVMDDFGTDLYAVPTPVALKKSVVDSDEANKIAAMVNKDYSDWQRQTQEAGVGGRGFGRGGYGRGSGGRECLLLRLDTSVIAVAKQQCPTNGDPAYDARRVKLPVGIPRTRLKADEEGTYILPDGSVATMQPDEQSFRKEADAFLSMRPQTIEVPPELQCPLCHRIFRDAVLIPCCQYSFCDQCIRQELIAKGRCPQCGSTKYKNDDLLPNIALRQAIERFMEQQVASGSGADDQLGRPKETSSAPIRAVSGTTRSQLSAPPALSRQQSDRGSAESAPAASGTSQQAPPPPKPEAQEEKVAEATPVAESQQTVKQTDTLGTSEPDAVVSKERSREKATSEVKPLEEGFKRRRKKKLRAAVLPGPLDNGGGHLGAQHIDGRCQNCGSRDHVLRDCPDRMMPFQHPPPEVIGQGSRMLPGAASREYFWGGGAAGPVPFMQQDPYFNRNFMEGSFYRPGLGMMPWNGPMAGPSLPYGPPFAHPHFGPGPMQGSFLGGLPGMHMGMPPGMLPGRLPGPGYPMDTPPLTREEFMLMQDRARRRLSTSAAMGSDPRQERKRRRVEPPVEAVKRLQQREERNERSDARSVEPARKREKKTYDDERAQGDESLANSTRDHDSKAVSDTRLSTALGSGPGAVSTVEHLLSALEGLGVGNVRIELHGGPEVPLLDGSARLWVEAIEAAGVVDARDAGGATVPQAALAPTVPVIVQDGESFVAAFPAPAARITCGIDFPQASVASRGRCTPVAQLPVVGRQWYTWNASEPGTYAMDIAGARTFGIAEEASALPTERHVAPSRLSIRCLRPLIRLLELKLKASTPAKSCCRDRDGRLQVEYLRAAGLIKGGSLDNALVCSKERGWLNPPLRYAEEPVRHKLLDLVGDLALCGEHGHPGLPLAHVVAFKAGHSLHVKFGRALLDACR